MVMSGLLALRNRLPLVVFLLLFVLLLMLVGFACACFGDEPMQAVDRALSVLSDQAPVIEVWSSLIAALFAAPFLLLARRFSARAPSQATLQRFLI